MNPNKIRDLQIARNAFLKLTEEEVDQIDYALYENDEIQVVEAIHHEGGEHYTWYVPRNFTKIIMPNDLLLVEQRVGFGRAVVQARTYILTMSKQQHIDNIHPYCKVLAKL